LQGISFPGGLFFTGNAQDGYQKKVYNQNNGLSHNFVHSIARDSSGFLWIATWDGLSRFDGYEFRNYYHTPNDPFSFPFFIPSKVLIDAVNNVWIFTRERTARIYDRAHDSFMPVFPESIEDKILGDIIADQNGDIWVTLDTSVCEINVKKRNCTSYRIHGENDSLITLGYRPQIAIDNTGAIWLYYHNNINYLVFRGTIDKNNSIFLTALGKIHIGDFSSTKIHNEFGNFNAYVDTSGNIWQFSKYGLFKNCNKRWTLVGTNDDVDPSNFKGKSYYIWTNDTEGIKIIDTRRKSVIHIPANNGNFIECVYIDQTGIIWSGDVNPSRDGIGLNRYEQIPEYFRHYLTGKNENNTNHMVFPVLKDQFRRLWIGTRFSDQLFRININGGIDRINYCVPYGSRAQPGATCFASDGKGLWIGTTGGQLFYYDFGDNIVSERYPANNENAEKINLIHNIIIDHGRIILNAIKGLYEYKPLTGSMELYYNHVPEGSGFSLVPDGYNGFWIGTFGNRIIHLDSSLKSTGEYKLGPENNIAEHICPGDSNDVWVALMGGGLGHLYLESGRTEIFTTENGLSNNVTYSIVKDKKGTLWISTNTGISNFDPGTRRFRNFTASEGLMINEFNSDSWFMTEDGEIFFGGIGGVVGFNPDEITGFQCSNQKNSLKFTDFKVSGIKRYFEKPVYESDILVLDKGDNNFQVTLVCLDFNNSERKRYRYRIEEVDQDWIECDHRGRNINYAHLTHGNYLLEAEVTDENGVWGGRTELKIRIPPRFTEIFWVRMGFVLLAISGFMAAGIMYLRQLRLKEKQAKDELKLESLRGQMNPHFIFNSLNSINYFISKEDRFSANNYIADFSRLIRSILTNMLSDYIPLENELDSIRDYLKLEHLRFGDKFDYSIDTKGITEDINICVFPGMIQPFIENAIWHGLRGLEERKGVVKIFFVMNDDCHLICYVEDDGIGRKMANIFKGGIISHRSRGIDIVRERLRIYNDMTKRNFNVKITDLYPERKETGTRVVIDVPVKII